MTTPSRPLKRRAMPASEWATVRKDAATSASLAGGGKAAPATATSSIKPEEEAKLPPIEEAKPEEVTLPRIKCEHAEVSKCGCAAIAADAAADTPAKPQMVEGNASASMQTGDLPPNKKVDEPSQESAGVMLALLVPGGVAKSLAVEGGTPAEEMHVTLGYFGKMGSDIKQEQVDAMYKCVSMAAKSATPMKGSVSGVGRFAGSNNSDGKDVVYASVDVPGLAKFRTGLMEEIQKCSAVVKSELHDFTPHITMKYVGEDEDNPVKKLGRQEVQFSHMVLAVGKDRKIIPLGEVEQTFKRWCEIVKSEKRLVTGIVLQPEVTDAQADVISAQAIEDAAHAFLAKYNSHTKIGLQHSVAPGSPVAMFPKGLHLAESYITPVDMILNGRSVKKGTWMMTVFVEDDDIWDAVKAGKIRGLSIGGIAKVQRLAS